MRSIRVKITAITVAAILTSILSVLLASYTTIQAENDRQSVEMMNLIVQNTRQSLEKSFEDIEQSVELVARIAVDALDSVTLVQNGVGGARQQDRTFEQSDALDDYLTGYCGVLQESFSSIANSTRGIIAYYYCIVPEVSERVHGFFYAKLGKTGFGEREPLDVQKLDPDDMEHNAWYFTPIQRGRPSWVGPYNARFLNGIWVVSYITPIYRSGTLIGVLGMDISLETLVAKVSPIRVYQTGFACLFDTEGRVIYHPRLEAGEPIERLGLSFSREIMASDSNGDRLIRYDSNGQIRQMSFTTLPNGMTLAVTAPSSEINASWLRLGNMIFLITLGIIALFGLILLALMRYITRPLQALTIASRKLATGDYNTKLDYHGKDEIGELTRTFVRMRDQQKRSIDDLNRRIYTDAMTGLPNMRHFFKLATTGRDRMIKEGRQPMLLYFNLIGMKHYNRQYGFFEGDQLIRELAGILSRHFGEQNTGRFSDDRFMALTDADNLYQKLQIIFRECKNACEGHSLPLRVGIYPNEVEDVDISTACDRARYACARDRDAYVSGWRIFDKEMLKQAESMRYVISHLDQALEEHWIKVYYQPIVRAANGMVCDEEALCRWVDPVRGMLSPGEFIPVLENARLITRLDLYMLDEIIVKLKRQQELGMRIVPQSLNLSRVDFDTCDIVEKITRRMDESGLPRSVLTIEVTESIIGSNFEFMKDQIKRFQELGFQVWMDDFGSGYSSLDVLQDIRFDLIKLDMRFLHRFDQGEESQTILTELIRLALSLGIDTVCEGVENAEQAAFLRDAGCTRLQGFYYSRPCPFEDIEAAWRNGSGLTYEDCRESDYYAAIGRVNLYDASDLKGVNVGRYEHYLHTIPMAILELTAGEVDIIRSNRSYRDFLAACMDVELPDGAAGNTHPTAQPDADFIRFLTEKVCFDEWSVFNDKTVRDGAIYVFARRIAENPVTGTVAIEVVTLVMIR